MRKTISVMLIALLLLSSFVSVVSASQFADLNSSQWDWARDAIDAMTEQGLIAGYSADTFGPADGVTTLQAMLFMSRIIGFYEPVNQQVLDQANELYGAFLSSYKLNNQSEIALLLYYNIFSETELKTYLAASKINQPLKRYEAAVFLTKTAGAEKNLSAGKALSFTDVSEIPENAKKYVSYVVEKGYMVGLSDTQFGASEQVNRAQMATMLYRVINDLNITYVTGEAVTVSESSVSLKVSGSGKAYNIPSSAEIRINGVKKTLKEINQGDSVILKYFDGALTYVDAFSPDIDSTGEGYVTSKKSGSVNSVTVVMSDSSEGKEYELVEDCQIFYDAKTAAFSDLLVGDNVTVSFKDGKICKLQIGKRADSVSSVEFVKVVYEPEIGIVVENSSGVQRTYLLADSASIKKNGKSAELTDLLLGDNLTLTLSSNKVTALSASSNKGSTSGTIEEILISANPSITVNNGKTSSTFALSNSTEITIDGQTGTIYDLKLGYTVDITLESDTVATITTKVVQTANTLMGTVDSVNANYGFLYVYATDTASGTTERMQIFTKKNNGTKIIDNKNNGNSRALKNVLSGESVLVTGVRQTDGTFEAATIIILAD